MTLTVVIPIITFVSPDWALINQLALLPPPSVQSPRC
jgi:hypothetical protein